MYVDFMGSTHNQQKRDYLARVNDPEFPKAKAAELAKKFEFDYWDGDRRINYGGYKYIEGRWTPIAEKMIEFYGLDNSSRILDVGCGKGFLLYEFKKLLPRAIISGLDRSIYAIENSKEEVRENLTLGRASKLPYDDKSFDFVFSINTLHCLHNFELENALSEIERVSAKHQYLCVESFRNEVEKANLLYWQVTCEMFCTPEAWEWWFSRNGYRGDHSFIFFE
jgi:SAM-dependent methyltransferase